MKVAVVHEWLESYSGSEKLLEAILDFFPQAELFVLLDFLPESDRAFLGGRKIHTSFLNRLPWAKSNKFTWFLPLMPLAIEQFDLSEFDLIISISHAVAKGVVTGPDQRHLSYICSPMRYVWDLQHQYLAPMSSPIRFFAKLLFHYLRFWDVRSSFGVDRILAISQFVSRRVKKCYNRDAEVVYPWIDTDFFTPGSRRENFYVVVSRLVPYKKIDLIVDAFRSLPDRRLVVIGDGPELAHLKNALPGNVDLLGFQSREIIRDTLQRGKAFLFAAIEDFGIAPLEAQACGMPVIAFAKGGVTETIIPSGNGVATGVFFHEQTAQSIVDAILRFEKMSDFFSEEICRANALRFSKAAFIRSFQSQISAFLSETLVLPGNP